MTNTVKIEFGKMKNKTLRGVPYDHIHGYMNIEIGGRPIPRLGYGGKNDVCFNTWIVELANLRKAVQERKSSYTFDEYEQGQPAYLFEIRPQSMIALSLIDSESGHGKGDKRWKQVLFSYADFKSELLKFRGEFLAEISEISPDLVDFWTAKFSPQ